MNNSHSMPSENETFDVETGTRIYFYKKSTKYDVTILYFFIQHI